MKRNVRPSFSVFVICPKFGDARLSPGPANCGVLNKLIDSARTVTTHSRTAKPLCREAFTFAILPLRITLRPRLPAISSGAFMKRNAERGSNSTDVSGSPIVTLVWRQGMDGWKPYNAVFLNAAPNVRYGGFWIRVVAAIIDACIVSAASAVVQAPFGMAMGGMAIPFAGRPDPEQFATAFPAMFAMIGFAWALGLAVDAAYHIYFVAARGATLGKMVLGMKVVRVDGQPITAALAAGRWFASWVSALTLCIGYIIAGFDRQKRTLHDHICDTRVVRI